MKLASYHAAVNHSSPAVLCHSTVAQCIGTLQLHNMMAQYSDTTRLHSRVTPCAIKIEGKDWVGEGTTPVTTACPEAGK